MSDRDSGSLERNNAGSPSEPRIPERTNGADYVKGEAPLPARVTESIQRQFFPPLISDRLLDAVAGAAATNAFASSKTSPASKTWATPSKSTWQLVGACLLVIASGGMIWVGANWNTWMRQLRDAAPMSLAEIYDRNVSCGFTPDLLSEEPTDFPTVFHRRHGVALKLRPMPSEIEILGLASMGGLSAKTTTLLCRVEGSPVMVFVDSKQDDCKRVGKLDAGLYSFRREIGSVVLYELSPFDAPRISNLFDIGRAD